ncbi:polysaccharide biosynthesis protein HsfF [soil metagenome]
MGGSLALLSGRYVTAALAYAGTAVIARTLSPDDWGGYSLIFAVLGIFGVICDVEASRLVVAELLDPDADEGEVVGSYMVLRCGVAVIAYGFAIAVVTLGGYPDDLVRATLLGGSVLVLAATWNALRLLFSVRQWLRSIAVVIVGAQVVQFGLTLAIAARPDASLVEFFLPAIAFDIVVLVVLVGIARRSVDLRFGLAPARWWRWIRESAPIALGTIVTTVYFRVDTVMLSQLDTLESVGLYTVGYKFSDLIGFFDTAVMAAAFPLLVAAWPGRIGDLRAVFGGAATLLVTASVGAIAVFTLFAEPAIVLLYGSRFDRAADAARLLVAGQALHFFVTLCIFTLIAVGKNRAYVKAGSVGLVLNIGLNLVLIPRYSFVGSGVATILSEVVVLGILAAVVGRLPGLRPLPWAALGRAATAGAVTVGVGLVAGLVLPWPVAAGAAGATYLGVLQLTVPGGLRSMLDLLQPARAG